MDEDIRNADWLYVQSLHDFQPKDFNIWYKYTIYVSLSNRYIFPSYQNQLKTFVWPLELCLFLFIVLAKIISLICSVLIDNALELLRTILRCLIEFHKFNVFRQFYIRST